MNRTLTVKGIGHAKTTPDRVELTFDIETKDLAYDKALKKAADKIEALKSSLESVGFSPDELKTVDFNVRMNYEGIHDDRGVYRNVFDGYVCWHSLKLGFDLDNKLLTNVLNAITSSSAAPQFSIAFTVKNQNAIRETLLTRAVDNAKAKADVLTRSAGVSLGEILNIEYGVADVNVYSNTRFLNAKNEVAAACGSFDNCSFAPEEILSNDSVTITWRID